MTTVIVLVGHIKIDSCETQLRNLLMIYNMKKFIFTLLAMFYTFSSHSAFFIMDDYENEMEHNDPAIKYLIEKLPNGLLQLEDLTNVTVLPTCATKDVTIYFYSRSNPDKPVAIDVTNVTSLGTNTHFDRTKLTLIIVHGWHNNYTAPVNSKIKAAVLQNHDVNVFVVDWSPFAQKSYISAYVNIPKIGQILGVFLRNVSETYDYPLDKMKAVGHSLGAHIVGVAGKETNGELRSIAGLDPAGPLFTIAITKNRLTKDDAKYVQVIHTCGKLLGFYPAIGNSDYYPNGGLAQPGCGVINDIDGSCSHARAYEYYAESISSGGFYATECNDYYFSYQFKLCRDNAKTRMGEFHLDTRVGKFYLKTHSSSLYAKKN